MTGNYSYVGQGLTHPIQMVKGSWLYQNLRALVEQSMLIILNTPINTRFFLREYGSRCRELLFEQNDTILEAAMSHFIVDAIRQWERRVHVASVTYTHDYENAKVNCEIHYYLLNSTEPETLVWPFARKTKY